MVCTPDRGGGHIAYIYLSRDADCRPIQGARITIAFDENGKELVPGLEAKSNATGDYRIPVRSVPPPKDPHGSYFLIVRKDGYDTFVLAVTFGPHSRYWQNTIVLRKSASGSMFR